MLRRRAPSTSPGWKARPGVSVRARCDGAFTLVELLVAMVIGLVVVGGSASLMVSSLRSANAASSRTVSTRQSELFLARVTRELREAQRIETVNASTNAGENHTPVEVVYPKEGENGTSSVAFFVPNTGSTAAGTEVTWSCTAATEPKPGETTLGKCTRKAAGGAAVTMLTGVESATFTPYGTTGSVLPSWAGGSNLTAEWPSSIGIKLKVKDISQLDSEHRHAVTGVGSSIVVEDGVSLRNYSS
jgi:prepilin-type N-terminal cleavage/methylation domain-containing protein